MFLEEALEEHGEDDGCYDVEHEAIEDGSATAYRDEDFSRYRVAHEDGGGEYSQPVERT